MKLTPEKAKEMIAVIAVFGLTFLFFRRISIFLLPLFLFFLLKPLWKTKQWEEDDSADWWKKGRKSPWE